MTVKTNLEQFYNTEAKKYAQTRQKTRKEAKEIFEIIEKNINLSLNPSPTKRGAYHLLELGCGSGRFVQQDAFTILADQHNIDYTGVDISKGLLKFAKEHYPSNYKKNGHFVCDDMLSFIKTQKQESVDMIFAFASFQHISTKAERELLMHYFYQTLKYGGIVIMTNWAFSKWFRNRYRAACKKALIKFVYSLGKSDFRDIYVPWKGKDKEFARYYHLFSKKELKNLAEQAGFVIEDLKYIDKKGQVIDKAQYANNSLIVLKKGVYC